MQHALAMGACGAKGVEKGVVVEAFVGDMTELCIENEGMELYRLCQVLLLLNMLLQILILVKFYDGTLPSSDSGNSAESNASATAAATRGDSDSNVDAIAAKKARVLKNIAKMEETTAKVTEQLDKLLGQEQEPSALHQSGKKTKVE